MPTSVISRRAYCTYAESLLFASGFIRRAYCAHAQIESMTGARAACMLKHDWIPTDTDTDITDTDEYRRTKEAPASKARFRASTLLLASSRNSASVSSDHLGKASLQEQFKGSPKASGKTPKWEAPGVATHGQIRTIHLPRVR